MRSFDFAQDDKYNQFDFAQDDKNNQILDKK